MDPLPPQRPPQAKVRMTPWGERAEPQEPERGAGWGEGGEEAAVTSLPPISGQRKLELGLEGSL